MSNSGPSDEEKASEDAPCDGLARPTSESPCQHEISAQEGKQEQEDIKKGGHTKEYDGERPSGALVADENSPQSRCAGSPCCGEDEFKEAARGGGGGGDDDVYGHGGDGDDDDGYHTPTSPRHRIPTDLPCPPAPRKSPAKPRWRKRKAGDEDFHQVVRQRLQLPDEVELVFFPVIEDPAAASRIKKAGGDDLLG